MCVGDEVGAGFEQAQERIVIVKLSYTLEKEIRFESAHKLMGLPEGHPCGNLHGHSYRALVKIQAFKLDDAGMIVDFGLVSEVGKMLDHKVLNDVMPDNPTAENLGAFILMTLNAVIFKLKAEEDVKVLAVTIHETCTSGVTVEAVE